MNEPGRGWVAPDLAEEFPRLALWSLTVAARPGRSPHAIRERLRDLSSRFRGAQAVTMRQDAVPWAYRVFFRHIGLDPDEERTPIEAAALRRLVHGQFRSENLLDDALTIALVETGVPVWALDAERLSGELGLRLAAPGEALGRADVAPGVAAGRMVVADDDGPVAVLFGDLAPGHGVNSKTTRMTLFTVSVDGVPAIHVEEALWTCHEVLQAG